MATNIKNCYATLLLLMLPIIILSSKLNVPRVLLPYNHDVASKFVLKVHGGGCYKWTSSREEIVIEEMLTDGCSDEAVVSAVTRSPAKLTAIVLAKDIATGFSLRCDVIVDSVNHLEIVTTTRELYAEEAPEEFEVRAYDHQGNEFSTLEGQTFVWDLQTITDHKAVIPAQSILRFITFEASPYKTPPAIGPIEARGEQGYMVLIEGRQTGLARLSVRLAHHAYKSLPPAEVDLMVIANLIIEPQDVYILPRTSVKYSVFHLKQGIFHPVELEGSQYSLQVRDQSIATLDSDGISVTGIDIGSTLVVLQDINVKSSETLKQPTASLHVVNPSYLTITILPHNIPVLTVGKYYTFVVNVYDKDNNKIYLSDNIIMNTKVPSDYITTEYISKNGSYIEGIPIKKGATKISAELSAIEVGGQILELTPSLKVSQPLEICDQIRVIPPVTFLPWDPVTKPRYTVNLTAENAYGSVTWTSSESSLAEVTTTGQCRTKGKGVANITAALAINPHNKDDALIVVKEVMKLDLLERVLEVEVEKPLPLAIAMSATHGKSEVFFKQCHLLSLDIEIREYSFSASEFLNSDANQSCATVNLTSRKPGFSRVKVSYQGSQEELTDSTTIGAYNPLKPKSPSSGETVLALGTSRIVVFEGGPLPWINKPSGHVAKVTYDASEKFSVDLVEREGTKNQESDLHALLVECHELGEFNFTLRVGNEPSHTLPFPVQVSSSMKVICAVPNIVTLSSALHPGTDCPTDGDLNMVVAHCYKPLGLEVLVRDSEGRKFDNISSLDIDWFASESTLATFPSERTGLMKSYLLGGHELPLTAEQTLIPSGVPGDVSVKAVVTGYSYEDLKRRSFPSLQDSLRIRLVNDARLIPTELVLYNHKENRGEIIVSGGSGHFEMAEAENGIAKIEYIPQNDKIIVTPLRDGSTTITLKDLCLEPARLPSAEIRISSLGSLDLVVKDRVEVESSLEAVVIARDMYGNHVPVHSLMKLTPHPHSDIISVSLERVNKLGNAVFLVDGDKIGETNLKISCLNGTSAIHSPSRPIQVFPPLTLQPHNVTLIVGNVFQVEARGGPYPDSTIEFDMENDTVSNVSYAGVITALKLGTSRLTVRAVSQYKDGEPLIVHSKDSVFVRVIPLDSIHIYAPLRHIETGCTMPLYAVGDEGLLNPLSYATAVPSLRFEWALSNKQTASFKTVYSENGIVEAKENQGIVRFKALKSGRVTVSLNVSITLMHESYRYQITDNVALVDKMEIKVFDSLSLRNPTTEDAKLLLTPNSETRIITNREGEGKLTYEVDCGNRVGSPSSPLIAVSSEGLVTAGSYTGDASVIVTLKESFGVTQTLVVLVEIRPISYIESVVVPFMKAAEKFSSLPLGVSHEFLIRFHDNRGRVFDAANSALKFRPSRFDLVNVQPGSSNDTISVTIRDVGQTVVHIWDTETSISDFVRISSGPGVLPDKASVPVGSFVCFSSDLRSSKGEEGTWRSESSVLQIDPVTGVAVARRVGKALVSYKVSNSVGTATDVYISPIQKIDVVSPSKPFSNVVRDKDFFVAVVFEGEDGEMPPCFPNASLPPQLPFECSLTSNAPDRETRPKPMFSANAAYIPDLGFGCLLHSSYESDVSFATSEIEIALKVSTLAASPKEDEKSSAIVVPFCPAAVIEKSEITLTTGDPIAVIVMYGHTELLSSFTLVSDEKSIVMQIEDVEDSSCHLVFSANDMVWGGSLPMDPTPVYLISSLTYQRIQVNVSFEEGGQGQCVKPYKKIGFLGLATSLISHYQNVLYSILCLIITIICLLFAYYSLVSPGYKQTQRVGVFASSPLLLQQTTQSPTFPSPSHRPLSSLSSLPSETPVRRIPQSSPQGISLWTVDQEPVYGDPMFRSSPRPAYDGSPTYSRTPT